MTRAWSLEAGPGDEPTTIDVDSTICEGFGNQKEGASWATPTPSVTTRSSPRAPRPARTLHVRFRKGSSNTQRGAQRFVREVVERCRRAGASGALTLRCDSGFFSKYVVQACRDHQVRYSITVRQTPTIKRSIEQISVDVN